MSKTEDAAMNTPETDAFSFEALPKCLQFESLSDEQFSALTATLAGWDTLARSLERRLRKYEQAIANAPHGNNCELYCLTVMDDLVAHLCNCWKSRVGKEG